MIQSLYIKNLALIAHADISFTKGLNVITGETGSGKTACISALALLLGKKSDSSLIRRGEETAIVEASFHSTTLRRELSLSGKNRCFINDQLVPLSALKDEGKKCIELIDQEAALSLRAPENQLYLIDSFGHLHSFRDEFGAAYEEENALSKELRHLKNDAEKANRERELTVYQINEIEEANITPGEEENLFETFKKQAAAKDLTQGVAQLSTLLDTQIISQLSHLIKQLSSLTQLDSKLEEPNQTLTSAHAEIREASYFFSKYLDQSEINDEDHENLNARLTQLNTLKKKYGETEEKVLSHLTFLQEKLTYFESLEEKIQKTEDQLEKAAHKTDELAKTLSNQRKLVALQLKTALEEEIHHLNLIGATVHIDFAHVTRTHAGDDAVAFSLGANKGEKLASFTNGVSGGELARIFLACKILLAKKENIPTLIFDEIDASIGGETATLIGKKLRTLGNSTQLICITHFPQVAESAKTHLQMSKSSQEGRTVSQIHQLSATQTKQELIRMQGGLKSK